MDWLLIAQWGAIAVAVLFSIMLGRIIERLHWIRLLKNPPDPKDMEWFERRVARPFNRRRMDPLAFSGGNVQTHIVGEDASGDED